MNAKQSLRAAAKRIEELEYANKLYALDVVAYNAVIEGTTEGKSICEWCEDQDECEKTEKGGKGCKEWLLMFNHQEGEENNDETENTSDHDGDRAGADAAASGAGSGDGDGLGDLQAGVLGKYQIEGIQPE